MKVVIDWNEVQSVEGFYDNFLPKIEAPDWHGRNLNALRDSIVTGDVNGIEPPYTIQSINNNCIPENLISFQSKIFAILEEAIREGRDINVIAT